MLLPLWYAIMVGLVFIIFPIILLYCRHLYPNYSIFTRTISGLGNPEHRSTKIFNIAVITAGIILFLMPYYLFQVLPNHWMTWLGVIFLYHNRVGFILVGVFPEHKETPHIIAAVMGMGGAMLANLLLIYPILLSELNNLIVIPSFIALLISIPLLTALKKNMRSYVPDARIDKLLYNLNFWEWMQFIVLQVWSIFIYLNLLIL